MAIFQQAGLSYLIQATTSGAAVEVTAAQLTNIPNPTQVYFYNAGTVAISVGTGQSSTEAINATAIPTAGTPAAGMVMPGGVVQVLTEGRMPGWIAARTLTGTADVYVAPGLGA
jgi:hypothetical protein